MTSKTGIANMALQLLGQPPTLVNVDTDNTQRAQDIRTVYDAALDAALADHPWKFALVRATWAAKDTAPTWGYANAYEFATDPLCLDVYRLSPDHHGDEPLWDRVGNEIHTDEGGPLYVEYISRVTDTARYHPMFVLYLAAKIAAWCAYKITGKSDKADELNAQARDLARDARWKSAVATGRKLPKEGDFLSSRGVP